MQSTPIKKQTSKQKQKKHQTNKQTNKNKTKQNKQKTNNLNKKKRKKKSEYYIECVGFFFYMHQNSNHSNLKIQTEHNQMYELCKNISWVWIFVLHATNNIILIFLSQQE